MQKTHTLSLKILALLIIAPLVSISCQKDTKEATEAAASDSPSTNDTTTLKQGSLALETIGTLEKNLVANQGLTEGQAAILGKGASAKIEAGKINVGTALVGEDPFEDQFVQFIDELVQGAMESFVDPDFGISDPVKLNGILGEIIKTSYSSMKGNLTGVEQDKLYAMLSTISAVGIGTLNEAGYDKTELADASYALVESAISSLDDTGLLTEDNVSLTLDAIIGGAMGAIDDLSLDSAQDNGVALKLTEDEEEDSDKIENLADFDADKHLDGFTEDYGESELDDNADYNLIYAMIGYEISFASVASLDEAGFSADKIGRLIKDVIYSIVSAGADAGLSTTELATIFDEVLWGAMDALDDAGLTEKTQLMKSLGSMIYGGLSALNEAGVGSDSFEEFIEIGMFVVLARVQLVDGLSKEDVKDALKFVVANASESISEMGLTEDDSEEYVDLVTSVIISALRALDDAGVESSAISGLLDDIILAAIAPLKDEFTDFDSFLGSLEAELELSLEAQEEFDELDIGGSGYDAGTFIEDAENADYDPEEYGVYSSD